MQQRDVFLKTINSKGTMDLSIDDEISKDIIRSLELTAVKKAEEKINKTTNGKLATLDSKVKEGSEINIIFAKNGKDAKPKVMEQIKDFNSISIYIDNKIINIEPKAFINDEMVELDKKIGNVNKKYNTIDICVTVNSKKVTLRGKEEYIFVDIFNFIDFDLKSANGTIKLKLNEEDAGYTDKIESGDVIKVFWDN